MIIVRKRKKKANNQRADLKRKTKYLIEYLIKNKIGF